jgi:NADH-quinone oxidoreductase subunit N
MGFLFFGLICNTDHSIDLMVFYFVVYAFSTAAINYILFDSYVVSADSQQRLSVRALTFLTDLTGLSQKVSYLSPIWVLTLILFSMIGVPPLAGFFSKYLLLLQLFEQGQAFLLLTGLSTSLISAYYYLRVIKTIWFEQPVFVTKSFLLFLPDFFLHKVLSFNFIFLFTGLLI